MFMVLKRQVGFYFIVEEKWLELFFWIWVMLVFVFIVVFLFEMRLVCYYEYFVFQVVIDVFYRFVGFFVIWCNIGLFVGFEVCYKLFNLFLYLFFEVGRVKVVCCFDGCNSGQFMVLVSSGVFYLVVKDRIIIWVGLFYGFGFML